MEKSRFWQNKFSLLSSDPDILSFFVSRPHVLVFSTKKIHLCHDFHITVRLRMLNIHTETYRVLYFADYFFLSFFWCRLVMKD